ncbi:SDR family NAD(P)-dependent oxidoreductase [Mycolicibacterium tusciae]|uniref:SDR family NAD(P)-dependent oxidoreductase n=1 Tax=Mycolicibacterium tusciae TaxID=75922 RepID=UPI00024A1A15|nr:SDR family oxidoreductase [Mycolicibacterium tusciae]
MASDYRGVTALVTGASKGLGQALALELARRGARLILVARSEAQLRDVATEIRQRYGNQDTEVIVGDLIAPEGPQRILAELRDRGLTVDLLVNNAGSGGAGAFLRRPLDAQLRGVELNVNGLLVLTHATGGEMLARGSGGIINVSSVAAFQPMPFQATYAASKAFVLSFSESLAEELRGSGVRVMASHPGPIDTGFFDGTTATMQVGADTPQQIAARTLDDFAKGRAASYPGRRQYRAITWLGRVLPRVAAARFTGTVNRRQHFDEVVDIA